MKKSFISVILLLVSASVLMTFQNCGKDSGGSDGGSVEPKSKVLQEVRYKGYISSGSSSQAVDYSLFFLHAREAILKENIAPAQCELQQKIGETQIAELLRLFNSLTYKIHKTAAASSAATPAPAYLEFRYKD